MMLAEIVLLILTFVSVMLLTLVGIGAWLLDDDTPVLIRILVSFFSLGLSLVFLGLCVLMLRHSLSL